MSEYFLFDEYKKLLDDPSRAFIFGKYYSYLFDTEIVDFLVAYFKTDENGKYYITDKNKVYEYLKDKTNKKISEVIIDALFKDNIYNVWINIKEMLRFNSRLEDNEKVLSKEKIAFYNLILNFDSVSCDDKMKIYNKLKNGNFSLTFYEDLTSVKNVCYNKIKDNLVNISLYSEKYDVEKSKKHGVKVYDFRDKEYTMLVRTMAPYYEESHYRRNCYSIISNENNAIFGERDSFSFLYGYSSFDNDHVLHMLEKDAYSLNGRDTASRYVNRIMTTSELIMSNLSYNEIQLVNKKSDNKNNRYTVKKPDYLVVFDVVTDRYIQESKRLNIPIVIISKSRVNDNYKSSIVLDEDYDAYVNNVYNEMEHRVRR